MKSERKRLTLFWLSFCNLFGAWKILVEVIFSSNKILHAILKFNCPVKTNLCGCLWWLIFTLHCSQWVVFVVDNVMEHFSSGSQSMLECEHIIGYAIACCCCCSVIKENKPTAVYLFYTIADILIVKSHTVFWHTYYGIRHYLLAFVLNPIIYWHFYCEIPLYTDTCIVKSHSLLTFILWSPNTYWHLHCEVLLFTDILIVTSNYLLMFVLSSHTVYWHLYCEVPLFTDVCIVKSNCLVILVLWGPTPSFIGVLKSHYLETLVLWSPIL